MDLRPGVMVGDHARLLRPLGEGGMGTVWVAEHLRLETEVAVKLIADPALRKDADLMERLRREAKAAARIRSPHIVHIYDHGAMPDGTAFLLMELLDGESLADRITRQRTLDFLITAEIISQTASALEAAHAIGIVHRDIKPDNIFLTGDPARPFVKVLDFGIALRHGVDNPELRLTATDRIVGTPAYMSPEQLLSAKEPGPHVDLWALAVTAYEMLTGEMPFEGETLGALMMAVTSGDFVRTSARWEALPRSVDTWFEKGLALDVQDRFASARALSTSFSELCHAIAKATGTSHAGDGLAATVPADEGAMRSLSQTIALESGAEHPAPRSPTSAQRPPATRATVLSDPAFVPQLQVPSNPGVHSPAQVVGTPHWGSPPASPQWGATAQSAEQSAPRPASSTMGGSTSGLRAPPRPAKRGLRMLLITLGVALAGVALFAIGRLSRDDRSKQTAATGSSAIDDAPPAPSVTASASTNTAVPAGMVLISAGTYPIGCDAGETHCYPDEQPAHMVVLPAFAIMRDEVTTAEYAACAASHNCPDIPTEAQCRGGGDAPARCVTWPAAAAFCKFKGWRLPSEQEWEAAARGVAKAPYPWGSVTPSCELAVLRDASGPGCGAGAPKAGGHAADVSSFGVKNMAGNVREWTSSPYGPYPGSSAKSGDPEQMINRGGSYLMDVEELGAAFTRLTDRKSAERPDLGVRCAADLSP